MKDGIVFSLRINLAEYLKLYISMSMSISPRILSHYAVAVQQSSILKFLVAGGIFGRKKGNEKFLRGYIRGNFIQVKR